MTASQIRTVTGLRSAGGFAFVSPHEHLLGDSTVWHDPEAPAGTPLADRDNLVLGDETLAARELALIPGEGVLVVECTVVGMAPDKTGLARIAERVGPRVGIVAGAGWYVGHAVPEPFASADTETLLELLLAEIDGRDSGIPSGVIGEIGTSAPLHPCEVRFLQAAAEAQRRTGLAVQVHLDGAGREGTRVLEILRDAGADLSRVSLSHLDDTLDADYCLDLLASDCYVELDAFGASWQIPGQHVASDAERLDLVEKLWVAGHGRRVLMAQDVWLRESLTVYGGNGYAHLVDRVVPEVARRGLDGDVLTRINPLTWLTGREHS